MQPSVANLRRKICLLELDIERQEAALTFNRSLLRDLKARLANENPTFPILTLPPEIASEVFIHCVPENACSPSYAVAPFALLRVCKAWTRIALSTPALWTKIWVEIPIAANATTQIEALETMAKRAGQLPLALTITVLCPAAAADAFWPVFCTHSHRVQRLEIADSPVSLDLLARRSPAFSALEHLSISSTAVQVPLPVFRNAPLLRSVELTDTILSRVPLPFENITNLVASIYWMDEILDIIRALPNLLVLHYTQYEELPQDRLEPVALVHNSLREIHLTEPDEDQSSILGYLALPKLDVLVFEATDPTLYSTGVAEFIERSHSSLRRLAFHCAPVRRTLTVEDWVFLQRARQIAEMEIDYPCRFTAKLFCAALSLPENLPELKKLVLRCRQFPAVEDDEHDYELRLEDEDEVALADVVGLVLDAVETRVVGGQARPFQLRILAEDNNAVGLVSLSDKQAQQCRQIQLCGADVWIGPEGRNLAA